MYRLRLCLCLIQSSCCQLGAGFAARHRERDGTARDHCGSPDRKPSANVDRPDSAMSAMTCELLVMHHKQDLWAQQLDEKASAMLAMLLCKKEQWQEVAHMLDSRVSGGQVCLQSLYSRL